MSAVFPFGQPLQILRQADRRKKKIFVLGVYASAVHARWLSPNGRTLVNALAVASEPYIFWRGERAAEIVTDIKVPPAAGRLVPAIAALNGPSGVALDDQFLKPLGFTREDAWLCDLVPHSCVNASQQAAIDRAYMPLAAVLGLPTPTVPPVPTAWTNEKRRAEILSEIIESGAETLLLLGDQPIKWFLHHYVESWRRLSQFKHYGQLHRVSLSGHAINVLPLVHVRQAARLGAASDGWAKAHEAWVKDRLRGDPLPRACD